MEGLWSRMDNIILSMYCLRRMLISSCSFRASINCGKTEEMIYMLNTMLHQSFQKSLVKTSVQCERSWMKLNLKHFGITTMWQTGPQKEPEHTQYIIFYFPHPLKNVYKPGHVTRCRFPQPGTELWSEWRSGSWLRGDSDWGSDHWALHFVHGVSCSPAKAKFNIHLETHCWSETSSHNTNSSPWSEISSCSFYSYRALLVLIWAQL